MSDKIILITGGSGFLGRHLGKELTARGHTVQSMSSDCDLRRQDSCDKAFPFDVIFHLAANQQAGDWCMTHQADQWIDNSLMNAHMLDWWVREQSQATFVTMGTSASYDCAGSLCEKDYLTGLPHPSLVTYGMVKRSMYVGLEGIAKQHGLRYLYLVPSTLYGPGYDVGKKQPHFIFDLVRKIIAGKDQGEPVVLWGDGLQRRELVHVQDFIMIALKLLESGKQGIYNVGAGTDHTIREFAQMICDAVDYDHRKVKYDESKYVGDLRKLLCNCKLTASGCDVPRLDIRDGISELVEWQCEHCLEVVEAK